jgi:hypothetical protein
MARPRQRVCLQEGLHLDLNQLARAGLIERGAHTGERGIQWTHPQWGLIASGFVSADLSAPHEGWLRIRIGDFAQQIALLGRPRRFGGRQWYFVCPITNRLVSVVWKPAGADKFCSRHAWGPQVAYLSQFGTRADRAHLGKARISLRLGATSDLRPWDLPSKPKWMRWKTYSQLARRYVVYQLSLEYLGRPPPI